MQVLKAVVAEFDAGELITQRELVSHRVHQVICLIQSSFSCLLQSSFILYRNLFFAATCCWSGPAWIFVILELDLDPQLCQYSSGSFSASKWKAGSCWGFIMESWKHIMEPWRVLRPVLADSAHFDEEPDPIKLKGHSWVRIKLKSWIRVCIKVIRIFKHCPQLS